MLVMTHRKGDVIDMEVEGIKITLVVLDIHGRQLKLGYKAPPAVKILRDNAIDKEPKPKQ